MVNTIKAVDFGSYTEAPTDAQVDEMYADGVRLAVIGLWAGTSDNPKAQQQLMKCKRKLYVAGYSFPSYPNGLSSIDTFNRSKSIAGPHWRDLNFLALDFEHDVSSWGTPDNVVDQAVKETIRLGKEPVIYSSQHFWSTYMSNTVKFFNIPAWFADYNGRPSLVPRFPFGNIQKYIGHQYLGTVNKYGLNVDLNIFDEDFIKGETMPTDAQWLAAAAILAKVTLLFNEKQQVPVDLKQAVKFLLGF